MNIVYKELIIDKKNSARTNKIRKVVQLIIGISLCLQAGAQPTRGGFPHLRPDQPDIHGVLFSKAGTPLSYPEMELGGTATLELSFDDFDARLKNYSYTYQRCDQNWEPVLQSSFDYIKGFAQNRIQAGQFSSLTRTKYVHYTATLPTGQSQITKSGNYLIKVYLDGDSSKLAFERRMLVVDPKVTVSASVIRPSGGGPMGQGDQQCLDLSITVNRLSLQHPRDQIKVVVLQNWRWEGALRNLQPSFMRGTTYQYNSQRDLLFAAGKEYRWADLRSFRFLSDRVAAARELDGNPADYEVTLKVDDERAASQYMPYQDYNGFYQIASTDNNQVSFQGQYALVRFSYKSATGTAYDNQDLYILGQFNQYRKDDQSRMVYNPAKGLYEKTLLLKQGYYSYLYGLASQTDQSLSTDITEGNYWETENTYTVLVYYTSYSDRAPELVACQSVSSRK